MRLDNFMTSKLVTVSPDDKLGLVREIFFRTGFHHLLVMEGETLVGLISDRDLLRSISPNLDTLAETEKDAATLNKKVHQIMTRHVLTLPPDADIQQAIHFLSHHSVSCVPIQAPSGKTLGIVTWRDILRVLQNAEITLPE